MLVISGRYCASYLLILVSYLLTLILECLSQTCLKLVSNVSQACLKLAHGQVLCFELSPVDPLIDPDGDTDESGNTAMHYAAYLHDLRAIELVVSASGRSTSPSALTTHLLVATSFASLFPSRSITLGLARPGSARLGLAWLGLAWLLYVAWLKACLHETGRANLPNLPT